MSKDSIVRGSHPLYALSGASVAGTGARYLSTFGCAPAAAPCMSCRGLTGAAKPGRLPPKLSPGGPDKWMSGVCAIARACPAVCLNSAFGPGALRDVHLAAVYGDDRLQAQVESATPVTTTKR